MATLRICDESVPGAGALEQLELSGLPDVISVEELIRWRVREEVARYNATKGAGRFPGLVKPSVKERELNGLGHRAPDNEPVKWEQHADTAIKGFERNSFFVMVDGRQVCNLSDEVNVLAAIEAVFIKLVPLVGG
ncbi:hypothetical protein CQ020_23840 [Arthrobacter sp. MYb23]|uniref:hypothetical protein n=1 Tax=unclassified Arthrobacter TaxID=235627 RepID=UPI000CFD7C2A|nr:MULTISPECIES: hypothetical protein [unclassified Arthrobacter]PRB32966.1 hypothetical protein CQ038_23800 [Arthrobacter sp. MYb51]PRB87917.1 hypothetical protein CQ020_23840 [Arthrobacter sp. MYb23]